MKQTTMMTKTGSVLLITLVATFRVLLQVDCFLLQQQLQSKAKCNYFVLNDAPASEKIEDVDVALAAAPATIGETAPLTTGRTSTRARGSGGYDGEFVDEQAVYENGDDWNTYPFSPEQLVEMAKCMYDEDVRFGTKDGGDCLAEDFEFCAGVVGPLGKAEYLSQLENFDLEEAFDIRGNVYGFSVDPLQPGRVWFFNRARAQHVGEFMGAKPTGKLLELPPQLNFFQFDDTAGKLREYGFYTVDRRQGNTGGLGGAFGFMYGVGKAPPFPEGRPLKRSKRFRLISWIGRKLQNLANAKKAKANAAGERKD